ncbi:MAG: hypothetical protein C3F07_07520 [Anaerolineales bacterium]|nr:hypothetical protein [Anaerolineae bacterium]PWB74431.1 MAG: hypothetical protein C3F07_07520 [Anaerolineales bacterium]
METLTSLLAILTGILLRLAIPIALTALFIVVLRRLDSHWQAEAELHPLPVQKPECWKVKGCAPDQVKECAASASPLPCWQVFRTSNGYLREECLNCKVFVNAPTPTLTIEPRRM